MQKRRERIERWRAERKKKELEIIKKEVKNSLGLYIYIFYKPLLFKCLCYFPFIKTSIRYN